MNKDFGGGFILLGTIGSGGDITMETLDGEPGSFSFVSPQVISGTLIIGAGTALVPYYNTTTPIAPISFNAENIILEAEGQILTGWSDWSGFQGGDSESDGQGTAPGIFGTGPNGSGGAHAGNGGMDAQGDLGGVGYCNFEHPETIGSGGAGGGPGYNNLAAGGTFLELSANNELTVNGSIIGRGGSSEDNDEDYDGGGGGGGAGIILSADVISGTPELIDVSGGNSIGDYNNQTSGGGGGGGGGCVKIVYGTSNSINPETILAHGGYGYQRGGAGVILVEQTVNYQTLYVSEALTVSSTIGTPAVTRQTADNLTINKMVFTGENDGSWDADIPRAIYEIPSGKTLTITGTVPFEAATSSNPAIVRVLPGATLKLEYKPGLENVILELHEGGAIVDRNTDESTTLQLQIGSGATLDMRGFTTATPLELRELYVGDGGVVTHGSHEGLGDTETHMVNIHAETQIVIDTGGKIDVSGKGFAGGVDGGNGNGPGGGEFADMFTAVGAGHGGEGTSSASDGTYVGVGGNSYCDAANPSAGGSGGASGLFYEGTGNKGGNGGGLVWLTSSSTIRVNGEIIADGSNGVYDEYVGDVYFISLSGGGSGGAVKLRAETVDGAGQISVRGGDNGVDPSPEPTEYGGGGGGCVFLSSTGNSITTSSINFAGGGLSTSQAEEGLFTYDRQNRAPGIFVDVERPAFMHSLTDARLDNWYGGDLAGDYIYAGTLDGNFVVMDISSSTTSTIVGEMGSATERAGITNIKVSGNYAYVASMLSSSGEYFRVIDISSSTHPVEVGDLALDVGGSPELMFLTVSGNYAYLTATDFEDNNKLFIINISNPASPSLVGTYDDLFAPIYVQVMGGYAYVSLFLSGSPLQPALAIIDVSNPASPVAVGLLSLEEDSDESIAFDRVFNFVLSEDGNYIYTSSNDSGMVSVIDVSDKENPQMISWTEKPKHMSMNGGGIDIKGDFAYVNLEMGNQWGIGVVDIQDPNSVNYVGYSLPDALGEGPGFFLKVKGNYVYRGDYSGTLAVFDISRSAASDPNIGFYIQDEDTPIASSTLSVKVEYTSGSCPAYTSGSYATFATTTATSTYASVTIDNGAPDHRRIKGIEIGEGEFSSSDDVGYASVNWLASEDLPGIEGEYCVSLTPYDGIDEGVRVAANVVVDNPASPPTTPILTAANKTQTSITLSWNPVGAAYYTISSSISEINTDTDETSVTYAGLSPGTTYTFQIKATDYFNNVSAYSDILSVSTNASSGGGGGAPPPPPPPPYVPGVPSTTPSSTPSNPSGLILINGGAAYTNSRNVTLTFNTNFTETYALSDSGDFTGKQFLPIVPTTAYALSQGDGEKRIYARFTNMFGVYDAYDVILLDTQAPSKPAVSTVASPDLVLKREGVYMRKVTTSTNRVIPTITGTAEPNTRMVFTISSGVQIAATVLRLANIQTFYTPVGSNGQWSFTFPVDMENTTYQLALQSEDGAGNISQPVYSYFDFSVSLPPQLPPVEEEPEEEIPPPEKEPEIPPACTTGCEPETNTGDTTGEGQTGEGAGEDTTGSTGEGTATETETGQTTEQGGGAGSENTGTDQGEGEMIEKPSLVSTVGQSVSVVGETIRTLAYEVAQIPAVKAVVEVAAVAVEKTKEVIDNPVVEKTNETVATPVIATVAVANVVAGGASVASQALMYLRLIFSQPLLLIRRRKQKSWGTVFNAYSKQPIDLALVRLIDHKTGQVVRTQVTDAKGRYFMIGGTGIYRLEATKEGFDYEHIHIDEGLYPNIYRGEQLAFAEEHNELNYNIPLHQKEENKTAAHIIKEYGSATARKTTSMVGAIATVGSFIISPKPWVTALLVVHIVLYGVMKRLAQKKVKGRHGVSVDGSGRTISKVVIRVFDATYNKLVDTAITDGRGWYAVLVGPSTYYITAEKQGYEMYKSGVLDYSSEKTNGVGGVIAEDVVMKALDVSAAGNPPKEIARVRTMPMI